MKTQQTPNYNDTLKYDDLLPLSLDGTTLLDRHNDIVAEFHPLVEIEDRERIVSAANSYDALLEAAKAVLNQIGLPKGIDDLAPFRSLRKAIARAEV